MLRQVLWREGDMARLAQGAVDRDDDREQHVEERDKVHYTQHAHQRRASSGVPPSRVGTQEYPSDLASCVFRCFCQAVNGLAEGLRLTLTSRGAG